MDSKDMINYLKSKGYHLTIIEMDTGIQWHRLDRSRKGAIELRESEYRALLDYYVSKGGEV